MSKEAPSGAGFCSLVLGKGMASDETSGILSPLQRSGDFQVQGPCWLWNSLSATPGDGCMMLELDQAAGSFLNDRTWEGWGAAGGVLGEKSQMGTKVTNFEDHEPYWGREGRRIQCLDPEEKDRMR